MKRFYCTVCKKVKRVRKYPLNVATPDAYSPMERVGSCTHHSIVAGRIMRITRKVAR